MPSDPNQLIYQQIKPISGRTVVLFAAVLAATVAVLVPFLPGHGLLFSIAVLYAACLVALAVSLVPLGWPAVPALALRPASWKPVVLGPIATVVLSVLVSQIGPEVEGMKQMAELVQTPSSILGSVVVLAIVAPVVEELIFRGLLYSWIDSRWGPRWAIPVTALGFAMAHFDPTYMLLVLPLGFLFSWLRWRTNSLLPSIASHMVNNGFAVLSVALGAGGG